MCRENVFLWVITGLLIALLWNCASRDKTVSSPDKTVSSPNKTVYTQLKKAPSQVTYYVHTVKWSGESLSIIAGWYTGDIQNWKILAEANPAIDPQVIVVGQKINIPEHIMTTRSPMTKAHVDSYYYKAGKQKTRSSPPETKDETPTLYGPKLQPQK